LSGREESFQKRLSEGDKQRSKKRGGKIEKIPKWPQEGRRGSARHKNDPDRGVWGEKENPSMVKQIATVDWGGSQGAMK